MASRWRGALAVFLATCVIAAGVVTLVFSQQGRPTPGAAPGVPYSAHAEVRQRTGSVRASAIPATKYTPTPRPTLTVDSGCRPGAGRLGQHFNEDTVSFERVPASLTELLEQTADVLEGKRPALVHSRPSVTPQGTLDWEIVR